MFDTNEYRKDGSFLMLDEQNTAVLFPPSPYGIYFDLKTDRFQLEEATRSGSFSSPNMRAGPADCIPTTAITRFIIARRARYSRRWGYRSSSRMTMPTYSRGPTPISSSRCSTGAASLIRRCSCRCSVTGWGCLMSGRRQSSAGSQTTSI